MIAVEVAAATLIDAAMLLLVGEVIETLSVARVVANLSDNPYAWIAGVLLAIVFLPVFARYNDWLGRVLHDRDRNVDSER